MAWEGTDDNQYTTHDETRSKTETEAAAAALTAAAVKSASATAEGVTPSNHLQLPQFYRHNPQVWFLLAERQFNLRKITDNEAKFDHLVVSLSEEVLTLIHNDIVLPTGNNMYGHLKTCLLKESALTNTNRAAHLLDFPGIGDLKPSQLMTKMMLLLPDKERTKPSCLFREIFLRQLPLEVRAHLTDKEGMTLKELSYKADKFYSSTGARISLVRSGLPKQDLQPLAVAPAGTPPGPPQKWCFPLRHKGQEVQDPLRIQAGKQKSRSLTVRLVAGPRQPTLFVTDLFKNLAFLVDLGSEADRSRQSSGQSLVAANDQSIKTYRSKHVSFQFGKQTFVWSFVIAKTQWPYLAQIFFSAMPSPLTSNALPVQVAQVRRPG